MWWPAPTPDSGRVRHRSGACTHAGPGSGGWLPPSGPSWSPLGAAGPYGQRAEAAPEGGVWGRLLAGRRWGDSDHFIPGGAQSESTYARYVAKLAAAERWTTRPAPSAGSVLRADAFAGRYNAHEAWCRRPGWQAGRASLEGTRPAHSLARTCLGPCWSVGQG
jgi:hypothetical protein